MNVCRLAHTHCFSGNESLLLENKMRNITLLRLIYLSFAVSRECGSLVMFL